jgi:penicillin amidase/acyl-homoserine-lactone acylase
MTKRRILLAVGSVVVVASLVAFARPAPDLSVHIPAPGSYDVEILRDTWGVPHVFGKTDAATAYGLGYAHAEDDYATIEEALLQSRGTAAAKLGAEAAPIDYIVQLLRVRETVEAEFETQLSPEVRAVCQGYADGVNHWAALHPEKVAANVLPYTAQDIVAGFYFKSPFFFGVDNAVKSLMGSSRPGEVSKKKPTEENADGEVATGTPPLTAGDGVAGMVATRRWLTQEMPVGSNTFAVSPKRSADGSTMLNINSHQPWDGVVAWYEAHLVSDEGWDVVGGTFPGAPVILHGHNRHLGWAHTVNKPDLVDIYVLEINPDNPNQYRFDGEWRDFEVGTARMKVKLWGPISWTFTRETLWCDYGPAIRTDHGVYAVRYAGLGDIRQVEQWYRMGKASTYDQWLEAVKMQGFASFNISYADETGRIGYFYNARMPKRHPGYDWKKLLPGDTSETLWTDYEPFESLPQVVNPECGFLYNCNNTPFECTDGSENPQPDDFPASYGIETHMTNRALRARELFSDDEEITQEEFIAYKNDHAYADDSEVVQKIRELLSATLPDEPILQRAREVIANWDFGTDADNRGAAMALLATRPNPDGGASSGSLDRMLENIRSWAPVLEEHHGRLDPRWEEVCRLERGNLDLGLSGGPDALRAIYCLFPEDGGLHGFEDGDVPGKGGDCYILIPRWSKDGKLLSESIHQYGAAATVPESPHYADQSPLFARMELKPVWMDEEAIRANLERAYAPGE